MLVLGHLWASCWDRLPPSFHARIIRRNKHQEPPSGSVSWLELARKHRTFPLTSIVATRVACLREHRRRLPTLLRVAASCRQIARLARARRIVQGQPFAAKALLLRAHQNNVTELLFRDHARRLSMRRHQSRRGGRGIYPRVACQRRRLDVTWVCYRLGTRL